MKWLIASDIHGSAKYCRLLLKRFESESFDKLLLLGDILYHGPRNDLPTEYAPKQVIGMLNPLKEKILCVRGNCDAEVDQMVLDFPIMAEYIIVDFDDTPCYATHGHRFNPKSPFPGAKNCILLNGHTHIPANQKCGDFIYMNPGSVSIPKEKSPHSFMIYQNGSFIWKDLETNTEFSPAPNPDTNGTRQH